MLITLQFSLFDVRYLRPEVTRIQRPDWTGPAPKDHLRYIGQIIDRKGSYRGPWDGENKYCSAHKVIDFCGQGEDHFYTRFYKETKILYRRVISDGDCLAQFQVGFYDNLDEHEQQDYKTIEDRIGQYLALKVKIRIGNKLGEYVHLAECSPYLKEAYYWSTTKGRKTFNANELKYQVEEGYPLILVEYRADHLRFPESAYPLVDNKSIKKSGFKLQFGSLIHQPLNNKSMSIPTWLIGHNTEQAQIKSDFKQFSLSLRHLRINLLRVHSESFVMKRIGDFINNARERKNLKDPDVRELIALLLKKQLENISKPRRFNYQQEEILGLTYSSEPGQAHSKGLENLIRESERSYNWITNMPDAGPIQGHIDEIKIYYGVIKQRLDQKVESDEIFFSYARDDDKEEGESREQIVNELYESLIQDNYTVVRDKYDLGYKGYISDFMGKIGRGKNIVVAVSRKYVKSPYCMFELYEIARNSNFDKKQFAEKLLPIMVEFIDFTKPKIIDEYTSYWETEFNEWDDLVKTKSNILSLEQFQRYDKIKMIHQNFGKLMDWLVDINAMSVEVLKREDFGMIKAAIKRRGD